MSHDRRVGLVDGSHPRLSIVRQCALVGIARSSYYYTGTGEKPLNLELMRIMDEQFLKTPWYGSRQMAVLREKSICTSLPARIRMTCLRSAVRPGGFSLVDPLRSALPARIGADYERGRSCPVR